MGDFVFFSYFRGSGVLGSVAGPPGHNSTVQLNRKRPVCPGRSQFAPGTGPIQGTFRPKCSCSLAQRVENGVLDPWSLGLHLGHPRIFAPNRP